MYGADVITVINKAIDNNLKYEPEEGVYDINVKINMKNSVNANAIQYITTSDQRTIQQQVNSNVVIDNLTGQKYQLGEVLKANTTYQLLDTSNDGNNNGINDTLEQVMQTGDAKTINVSADKFNYIKIYTGFSEFKRKFFKCTNVGYSNLTGRVNILEFEEI